jgi:hypothetical protein
VAKDNRGLFSDDNIILLKVGTVLRVTNLVVRLHFSLLVFHVGTDSLPFFSNSYESLGHRIVSCSVSNYVLLEVSNMVGLYDPLL